VIYLVQQVFDRIVVISFIGINKTL